MNIFSFTLSTGCEGFYNITSMVNDAINTAKAESGICVIYTPHTTAAITINENADTDVKKDLR